MLPKATISNIGIVATKTGMTLSQNGTESSPSTINKISAENTTIKLSSTASLPTEFIRTATIDDTGQQQVDSAEEDQRVYLDIKIISAHVADKDPWPLQGLSDTFATVAINKDNTNSLVLCQTRVKDDTSYPVWNQLCRTPVLNKNMTIHFKVLDYDGLFSRPDVLGRFHIDIRDLIQKKRSDKYLRVFFSHGYLNLKIILYD